jgi:hypothetical protein
VIRRTSRSSRAFGALLATLLAVPTALVLSATPASAAGLAPLQAARVTSIRSEVGPGTPIWILEVKFTLDQLPSCPAELHWRVYANAGRTSACGPRQDTPQSVVTVNLPVVGSLTNDINTLPVDVDATDRIVDAAGVVRSAGGDQDNELRGAQMYYIDTPPRPVWIGVGDGYTSQMWQNIDGNTTAGEYDPFVPDAIVDDPNAAEASWVLRAAESTNASQGSNLNVEWALETAPFIDLEDGSRIQHVIAQDATREQLAGYGPDDVLPGSSAHLAAAGPGSQLDEAINTLRKHIHVRESDGTTLTSWNWVGLSAGLVDAGIPAAMRAYEGADPLSKTAPWEASTAAGCPDLSGALSSIQTNGAAWRSNIQTFVSGINAVDPSLRVIQVLYPWLTELAQTGLQPNGAVRTYTNPCASTADPNIPNAANNRSVIQALNNAVDLANVSATDNIFPLDLRQTFGNTPTGQRVYTSNQGAFVRDSANLWLTRPDGYPYPSSIGGDAMRRAAQAIVTSQEDDVTAPRAFGMPRFGPVARSSTGTDWWNVKPDVDWTATDESPIDVEVSGIWPFSSTPEQLSMGEGPAEYVSPRRACDIYGNCAWASVQLNIDTLAPLVTLETSSTAGPNAAGWYKAPVTVHWNVVEDLSETTAVSGVNTSTVPGDLSVSSTTNDPKLVKNLTTGTYTVTSPANTIRDIATNPALPKTLVLRVDEFAPTVGNNAPSGWTNQPSVTVHWSPSDTGGSGLVSVLPPDTVVAGNGVHSLTSSPACDVAGWCSTGEATVRIDTVKPTVDLRASSTSTQSLDGGTFTAATMPSPVCWAADQAELSGLNGSCTLSSPTITVENGTNARFSYTVTARDNAGNVTTQVFSYVVAGMTSVGNGRMTGGGSLSAQGVNTSFTLRCNGSPNRLDVFWPGDKRFTLTRVDSLVCFTNPAFSSEQPKAPLNTLVLNGTGVLADGRTATIQVTLTDQGEPGVNDTATFSIKVGTQAVLDATGTITNGNIQAHEAQGNGGNNNGNVNGPNGNSGASGNWKWEDADGEHSVERADDGSVEYTCDDGDTVRQTNDDKHGKRSSKSSKSKKNKK